MISIVGLAACSSAPRADDRAVAEQPTERPDPSEPDPKPDANPEARGAVAHASPEACALEPEWPIFQGNARRTGASDAPALTAPKVRWAARVGVQSWNNNPILAGDMVIVGSSGDVWNKPDDADGIYAFDRQTGALRWFASFDGDVNGVALVGCRVVAGSDDGTVRGFDPLSGDQVWSIETGQKIYSQPLPVPGGFFVAGAGGKGRLVDPATGQVTWVVDLPGEVRQGGAFDGESIWVGMTTGDVWRLSLDGERQWAGTSPSSNPVWGAPTITDAGAIYGIVRDSTYGTPALAGATFEGAPLWDRLDRATRANWANVRTSAAFRSGKAYHLEAYSNEAVEWDPARARVDRVLPVGDCHFPSWASPILNATQVILPRHDGGLYAVDLGSGQQAWGLRLGAYTGSNDSVQIEPTDVVKRRCTWQPSGARPLFATPAIDRTGALYVGSGGGWFFAIDSGSGDK